MQAPIPQELSALIALQQGMQQGRVSPVTPQGSPTVAAQLTAQAQQPAQPAMQGIIQQAGTAAQIEAMKQQQMQRAIQQLVAQQRPGIEGGIAAAPGAQTIRMADGGIVGYAEPGVATDPSGDVGSALDAALKRRRTAQEALYKFGLRQRSANPEGFRAAQEELSATEAALADAQKAYTAKMSTTGLDRPVTSLEGLGAAGRFQRAEEAAGAYDVSKLQESSQYAQAARDATAQAIKDAVKTQAASPPKVSPSQRPPVSASDVAQRVGGTDIVNQLIGQQRALYGNINTAALTGEDISAQAAKNRQVKRQFLISQGIDPDAVDKWIEEDKELFKKKQDLIQSRISDLRGQDDPLSRMSEALMGFRQMRGQGIGTGITSSAGALMQGIKGRKKAISEQQDLELEVADLETKRRRLLLKTKEDTANGDWEGAQTSLNAARALGNEQAKLLGGTFGKQAELALRQRELEEVKLGRAATSRQHAEQMEFTKNMGLLNSIRDRVNQIALKIGQKYEKNPVMMMYNAQAMTGSVDPKVQSQYDNVVAARDKEISDATSEQVRAAKFIESRLYGQQPSPVDVAPKPRIMTEADIKRVVAERGKTPEEVKRAAKAQGLAVPD